ncbi:MAG: MFS transporter [Clostridia bacterium]|nr:MFS transporter [Clostridia bacterium]NCC43349.1 MFS transporter [Clostridia bacterium]
MSENKIFKRDFSMVIIGQIISLFGNAILRFALPLYLLNQTHSSKLFGLVSAVSFIPMIILSPIGGIFADRINKRNIMVILDFSTAGLTLLFSFFLGKTDLVILVIITLIILYGIQGAYQPSVQASIPALVSPENLVSANSAVTLVNSLASLIGPVLGGAVYGFYGIRPILFISIICFFLSAVMEIFIHIPFDKKPSEGSIFSIAKNDILESIRFIKTQRPIIAKVTLFIASINMVFSALIIIGLPVIITQHLGFDESLGNQLYGYCEGAMAAGGLLGGLLSGILSRKLNIRQSYILLYLCALSIIPIGTALMFTLPGMISYIIILLCCVLMMAASTIFSIEMMAYVQTITPSHLIGKVMSLALCLTMCASPLGQALYGYIFELFHASLHLVLFTAAALSCCIAYWSKKVFAKLKD